MHVQCFLHDEKIDFTELHSGVTKVILIKLDYRLTMKMMTVMVNTQTMGQRRLL